MTTKKFVNKVSDAVSESLSGLSCTYPHLDYHVTKRVVLAPNWHNRSGKVAIICGGGSGHEPFAAGFVGRGMLTAAVAGSVFAAPPPNHILHALNCVSQNNSAGTLVLIPNYTGDCLNFGIAIEKARQIGLTIAEVVIGDDCSIPIADQGRAGKRGLVGLVFVSKIAGALAERGKSLTEISETVKNVANNVATYGVGFLPCSIPGQGPMFEILPDEIEIGLGVHGEAGYKRIKWTTASKIVSLVLGYIVETLSLVKGNSVAVIVNNFGASSQLEQGIVVHEVVKELKTRGIEPIRVYSGTLMTSMDSAGMHVCILRLPDEFKNLFIECLDDKTEAPCWPGCSYSLPLKEKRPEIPEQYREVTPIIGRKLNDRQSILMKQCLINACKAIIEKEEYMNSLDRGCGDGDCGSTHRKLADGILSSINDLPMTHPASLLTELSWIAEDCMGGTSGAVYSLMFTTAASAFIDCKADEEWTFLWSRVWQRGIDGIMKYSTAKPGDRTLLDSLISACNAFRDNLSRSLVEAASIAANAARTGCDATKYMKPMAGRASYVKQEEFLSEVDAGSFGVAVWINAIAGTIANFK